MKLIIHGPPAVGKTYISNKIEQSLGISHINLGRILRKLEKEHLILKKDKEKIKQGNLVDDGLVNRIIAEQVKEKRDYLIDGYPRNLSQASFFYETFFIVDKILVLETNRSTDELMELVKARRICLCGETYNLIVLPPKIKDKCDKCRHQLIERIDQNSDDTIKRRIDLYFANIDAIVNFYIENAFDLSFYDVDNDLRLISKKIVNDLKKY